MRVPKPVIRIIARASLRVHKPVIRIVARASLLNRKKSRWNSEDVQLYSMRCIAGGLMANFTVRSQCYRGGSLRARRLECIICFENRTRVVVVLYNISVGSNAALEFVKGWLGVVFFFGGS